MLAVLTCVHHVQWVRPVPGGLHQCILCQKVVGRAEVYPKLDDLPEEFRRRWDAHEAKRSAPASDTAPAVPAKPVGAPAKAPAVPASPPAPSSAKAPAAPGPQPADGASV